MKKNSSKHKEYIHTMVSHTDEKIEYTSVSATVMEIMINETNNQDTLKRS